jgi:hypothetical protein
MLYNFEVVIVIIFDILYVVYCLAVTLIALVLVPHKASRTSHLIGKILAVVNGSKPNSSTTVLIILLVLAWDLKRRNRRQIPRSLLP